VNSYQVGFQTSNGHLYFDVWQTGISTYYEVEYTTLLSAGVWYHVACVYVSGVGSKIYVNGVDVGAVKIQGSETGTICESNNQPLYIGCRYHSTNGPYNFFDGRLDDIRIYSEALTSIALQEHYDATKIEHANYTLTATIVGSGVVAKTPDLSSYAYGSQVQLDATPSAGYEFADWSGDLSGSANPATITMDGNKAVTATFTLIQYTIIASAGTGGSITPSGSVVVNYGDDQAFTINPDSGYRILDVLVDGGSVGAVSSYTFTNVVDDHTIAAQFEEDIVYYSIIASAGVGGIIAPSGSIPVASGADQSFTITADTGYHIEEVLVDSVSEGAIGSYIRSVLRSRSTHILLIPPLIQVSTALISERTAPVRTGMKAAVASVTATPCYSPLIPMTSVATPAKKQD
jgi:hypothetical protein